MTAPAILSYGRPRRRLARVPLLFRARDCEDEDGIFALSYGKRVGLVHTRSGATGLATMADENGMLLRVPSDWPRLSWRATTAGDRERVLLMEDQVNNLDLRSQEFDNAAWVRTRSSVTANAAMAPDGTLTADRIIEDATAANSHYVGPNVPRTITADAVVTASRFFKAGTRTWARIFVSGGGGVNSFSRYINLATGALGSTTTGGTGTHIKSRVELWTAPDGGQWWRLVVTGTVGGGETAVSALTMPASADFGAIYDGDGASYLDVWGAQFEGGYGSTYTPAAGTASTRAADVAYFGVAFAPQELTAYLRGVETGALYAPALGVNRTALQIGSSNPLTAAAFRLGKGTTDTHFAQHTNALTVSSQAAPSATPAAGDVVEHRAPLAANGAVVSALSLNGGEEGIAAASPVAALGSSWAAGVNRVYLTGGLTANNGRFAYGAIALDFGTRELDELRELVEVA